MNGKVENDQTQERKASHSISFEAIERRVEFGNMSVENPNTTVTHGRQKLQLKISGTVDEGETAIPATLYVDVKINKDKLGLAKYGKNGKGIYQLEMEVTEEEFGVLASLRSIPKLTVKAQTWEPDSKDSKVGRVQTISLISNV